MLQFSCSPGFVLLVPSHSPLMLTSRPNVQAFGSQGVVTKGLGIKAIIMPQVYRSFFNVSLFTCIALLLRHD